MKVEIDGLHAATGLCLSMLQWLQDRYDFARILDMGCGGGILSVVSAGIWDAQVVSADIYPQALADTAANAAANGLSGQITALRSDGFSAPEIAANGLYDLILFNLLAEPIVRMAPQVKANLAPGGVCVIGGIFAWEADETLLAYRNLGFEIIHEIAETPWKLYALAIPASRDVTKA